MKVENEAIYRKLREFFLLLSTNSRGKTCWLRQIVSGISASDLAALEKPLKLAESTGILTLNGDKGINASVKLNSKANKQPQQDHYHLNHHAPPKANKSGGCIVPLQHLTDAIELD